MNFLLRVALPLVLLPLVEKGPDPEDVKPGWLGFAVFLLLAAAVVFLAFSLTKHLRRVSFDEGDDTGEDGGHGSPGSRDDEN